MPASPVSKTTCPMPSVRAASVQPQADLLLPPHQERQASRRRYVETGLCPALVQDPVRHEGLGYAFEGLGTEHLADKIAVDQLRCGLADDHCIRLCESLDSRCNIGRLTEGKLFLPPSSADVAHHNQTSVDAEPYRQSDALVLLRGGHSALAWR